MPFQKHNALYSGLCHQVRDFMSSDDGLKTKTSRKHLMHTTLKNSELLKHSKLDKTLQHVSVYIETIFRHQMKKYLYNLSDKLVRSFL